MDEFQLWRGITINDDPLQEMQNQDQVKFTLTIPQPQQLNSSKTSAKLYDPMIPVTPLLETVSTNTGQLQNELFFQRIAQTIVQKAKLNKQRKGNRLEETALWLHQFGSENEQKVLQDSFINPEAAFYFSPNPYLGNLCPYADLPWTDAKKTAEIAMKRLSYIAKKRELIELAAKMNCEKYPAEEIARVLVAKRNQNRIDSYKFDPEGLEKLKERNFKKYGNETGPTLDQLYEKYGKSYHKVIEKTSSTNLAMDACCGLFGLVMHIGGWRLNGIPLPGLPR